jgi:hypothetical protein
MSEQCICRLLIVGDEALLPGEAKIRAWIKKADGLYLELLEYDSERMAFQFETQGPPLRWLTSISRRHPSLTFLLDYDREERRSKGLAKAVRGQVEHFQVSY